MKKIFTLLLISFVFMQCNKTEEDIPGNPMNPSVPETNNLLSITTSDHYHYQSSIDISYSGYVFLSDNNGELIAESNLDNNDQVTFESDFDIENNAYNASFLTKVDYNIDPNQPLNTAYRINTFLDVNPATFALEGIENLNPNDESARFYIEEMGGFLEDFSIGNSNGSSSSSENGYSTDISIILRRIPENLYFSFRNENETFRRYFWFEDADGATDDTIDYNTIPILTNSVNINYPDNDNVSTSIYGLRDDDASSINYQISTSSGSATSSLHYLPDNIFDRYNTTTSITQGNERYLFEKFADEIVTEYTIPDFALEVLSSSPTNYEMETSSDYDYFLANFNFRNSTEKYSVRWSVYGVSAENIKFSIPNLIDKILEEYPSFSIDDLDLSFTRLERVNGIEDYESYIYSIIETNFVSKENITERVTYTK